DGMSTAPPLLAGNLLIVATQPGVLSGYDSGSGKLTWRYVMQATATDSQPKYPSAEVYAAPIVADGTLYVVSDDGSLTAFRQDARDHIGPELSEMVPEAGTTVRSEGTRGEGLTYGALIVDDGSGIDPASVSLRLDGEVDALALYHAGQNAIYNTPVEPLKEGQHVITIKASDWRGNATSQTWSFTVSDQYRGDGGSGAEANPFTPGDNPGVTPNVPNYPGNGGRNPNAPPPPPPIGAF
ncbi:MAG: PQQ-like beta-propeller repeat protein, partial [Armatimonadota bacterium]|nr:PQQ-like beta-propeller repeat protein [Armatimonadota bacterium]